MAPLESTQVVGAREPHPTPPHPPKREDGLRAYPSSEENETILPLVTFNTNDKNGALQFLTFFKYLLNFLTFTRDMRLHGSKFSFPQRR